MSIKKALHSLIKKSERYVKTDMTYLAHGSFWLTLWQVSAGLSSLILAIAFAYFLPKETFGNYKYILSLAAIAGSFSLSGISGAVTQAVAKGYEQTLVAAFRINLKWGSLVTIVSWAIAIYYFTKGNQLIALALFGIGIILPLYNNFTLYGAFLNGKKEFKKNTLYGIVLAFVPVIIIISSFSVTHNPAILAIISILAGLIIAMFFYFRIVKKYNLNGGISSEALSYGKHTSFMSVLGVFATQIDNVLLFHYLGAVELAVYTLALAFPQQIWNIFRNLSTLALPKFTEQNIYIIKNTIKKKMATILIVAVIISFLYILAAPFLLKIFFPQYPESIILSQILSLSIIGIASILPVTLLQARLETKKMYTYTLISSIFHIITALVFINLWGMWGAVISFTTTKLFSLLLSMLLIRNIGPRNEFNNPSINSEDDVTEPIIR